jgi:hypothetical protein
MIQVDEFAASKQFCTSMVSHHSDFSIPELSLKFRVTEYHSRKVDLHFEMRTT